MALAAFLVAAPVAGAACGGVKSARPGKDRFPGRAPLIVGDSVLLGAVDDAARVGYEVNTRGCRGMAEGLGVLRSRRRSGRLPRFAVLFLGANGNITGSQIRAAMRIMGPRRLLGLVTPRESGGGAGSDAAVIRAMGRRHPRRILVLDWVARSAGKSSWFAGDGLHLGPGGARGLARLLARGIRRAAPTRARFRRVEPPAGGDEFEPG